MLSSQSHFHIKKNDLIKVIAGREKGKTGKVTKVLTAQGKIIVEKLNLGKKHTKPTQKNPQGGITDIEKPIARSNVLVVCPKCNRGVRTAKKVIKDKKIRICKKCGQAIDK